MRKSVFIVSPSTPVAGGMADTLFLKDVPGLSCVSDGSMAIRPGTVAETPLNGVFACGQVLNPDATFVEIVQSAKQAAGEVEKFLNV